MKKAALILYGDSTNKIMFWILGRPYDIGNINIELDGETYEIFIFEIPYTKDIKHKTRQRKLVDRFLREQGIQSVFYIDDVDEELESIWSAVKITKAIEEIGTILGECIFNKNFGIISENMDPILIETISAEASSIMILKMEQDKSIMEELHKKIIKEMGLSIAFVNDIKHLIKQSEVIIWENSELGKRYKNLFPSLIIHEKGILLLTKIIKDFDLDDLKIKYSEEIGKLIIKLSSKRNVSQIASYFPHVHFYNEQGEELEKGWIGRQLKRNNIILTIQKC
ncbi:MAG: hypothetical protein ACOX89_07850 [Lutispora sp.]|jgi:hypothetical protein|uniref:hypothetical protein n=1 Tax=Lutispora sp. TaxID=2828727 RepID=UPI00356251E2